MKPALHSVTSVERHEELLSSILHLQRLWLAGPGSSELHSGFLISAFDPRELRHIVSRSGRIFYAQATGQGLAGYVLMTSLSEFTDLYARPSEGVFNGTLPLDATYLYQIAVDRNMTREGVGSGLLKSVLDSTDVPIVTDVLESPMCNEASIRFFRKHGFKD